MHLHKYTHTDTQTCMHAVHRQRSPDVSHQLSISHKEINNDTNKETAFSERPDTRRVAFVGKRAGLFRRVPVKQQQPTGGIPYMSIGFLSERLFTLEMSECFSDVPIYHAPHQGLTVFYLTTLPCATQCSLVQTSISLSLSPVISLSPSSSLSRCCFWELQDGVESFTSRWEGSDSSGMFCSAGGRVVPDAS